MARRAVVSAVFIGATAATAACQQDPLDESVAVPAPETSPVAPAYQPTDPDEGGDDTATEGGTCPTSSSRYSAREYQKRATEAYKYIAGGQSTNPVSKYPCIATSSAGSKLAAARNDFANGNCRFEGTASGTVCQLPASIHYVSCTNATAANRLTSIGDELDRCWGSGASGFFWLGTSSWDYLAGKYFFDGSIDPEPARLGTTALTYNGQSEPAVYVNSGTATAIVRWPGSTATTCTAYYPTPAAGQPCYPTYLGAGETTSKTMKKYGVYCWCS